MSIREYIKTQVFTNYNKKFLRSKFRSLLFILIIIVIIEFSYGLYYTNTLNEVFSLKYNQVMKPYSEKQIGKILNDTKSLQNISDKLDAIADWETRNFTDQYWVRYMHHDDSWKALNPPIDTYSYDSFGNIRPTYGLFVVSPYVNDPDWITYTQSGSCGELAYLFANVTNRTGYVTRVVGIDIGYRFYGIPIQQDNHSWVEIKINGEWYYFDPDAYAAYHKLNISGYENRWFGKPDSYVNFAPSQVLRIDQLDTQEDISNRYPQLIDSNSNYEDLSW